MRTLGGEGVFTLSVSFADSSPRVGAKGRPELGQAFGHHGRPPILRQSPCLSLRERCPVRTLGGEGHGGERLKLRSGEENVKVGHKAPHTLYGSISSGLSKSERSITPLRLANTSSHCWLVKRFTQNLSYIRSKVRVSIIKHSFRMASSICAV